MWKTENELWREEEKRIKDKITKVSKLLFKWDLELPGGPVETIEQHIRADYAFDKDRGVHLPKELADLECHIVLWVGATMRFTAW